MKKRTIFIAILAVLLIALTACSPAKPSGEFNPREVPVFVGSDSTPADRQEDLKQVLGWKESDTFRISEEGQLTYYRNDNDFQDSGMTLSDAEATERAEQFLSNLGLLHRGGYRTTVSRVSRSVMDGSGASDPVIVEYTVSFYRVHNGVDVVSDQEDGILLSFDDKGITSLRYFWRDIAVQKISDKGSLLTKEAALEVYNNRWDERHGDCCDPHPDPDIREAYLNIENTTRPCWVISEDEAYTNAWWIDMFTGEILAG